MNNYNFGLTNFITLYKLLNKEDLWEILKYNEKLNDFLDNQRIRPDVILINSSADKLKRFIDNFRRFRNEDLLIHGWYSHIMLECIVENVCIGLSTVNYNKIRKVIEIPSFYGLILLNFVPKYEVFIDFKFDRATVDLYKKLCCDGQGR